MVIEIYGSIQYPAWSCISLGYYWIPALQEVIARKHSLSQHGQDLKNILAEFG
jgi:hypothetical protein